MKKFQKYYYDKILKEADSKGGIVTEIDLDHLHLTELPDFLKDLTVTRYLNLMDNKLTTCKNIPKVVNDLFIGRNQIKNLDELQNIPNSLYAEFNLISSLESLSKFGPKNIQELYLINNQITSMKGTEDLTMDTLRVNRNNISSWEGMPNTPIIRISFNKLTTWEGMPSELTLLNAIGNWDVKNMNGFTSVTEDLLFSSTTFTGRMLINELLRLGKPIPGYIRIEPPH